MLMPSGAALAAALIVAVSLPALAGCATGSAGTDTLPTGSAASGPTGSAVSGQPERSSGGPTSTRSPTGPRLVFPPDVHLTFDYAGTGDAAKDAVLHDWETGQRVFNAAETVPDPTFRLLARYEARNALAAAVRTLRTKVERRQTIIGTRRFYDVAVGEKTASLARITWCVDDSQFFARSMATGKAVVHHGPGDFYQVHGTLQHDPADNIWVLVEAVSEEGVRC
jgi:hypothetical protein